VALWNSNGQVSFQPGGLSKHLDYAIHGSLAQTYIVDHRRRRRHVGRGPMADQRGPHVAVCFTSVGASPHWSVSCHFRQWCGVGDSFFLGYFFWSHCFLHAWRGGCAVPTIAMVKLQYSCSHDQCLHHRSTYQLPAVNTHWIGSCANDAQGMTPHIWAETTLSVGVASAADLLECLHGLLQYFCLHCPDPNRSSNLAALIRQQEHEGRKVFTDINSCQLKCTTKAFLER
jgi:hypothetical protein